ncbi:MAG: hypothetical protein WC655_13935 [Candidatus Hydrogenedentales bacterium]
MSIDSRLEQIERKLGMDADEDKPFVLEVASGVRFTTTRRQLREVFADASSENDLFFPGFLRKKQSPGS